MVNDNIRPHSPRNKLVFKHLGSFLLHWGMDHWKYYRDGNVSISW